MTSSTGYTKSWKKSKVVTDDNPFLYCHALSQKTSKSHDQVHQCPMWSAMDRDGSLARRRFGRIHLAGSFKCARDLDTEVAPYRRSYHPIRVSRLARLICT
jgi:hypothetical protein